MKIKKVKIKVYISLTQYISLYSDDSFRCKTNINADSVLYCSSPLTFDPAVLTVLLTIRSGARLVMSNIDIREPLRLLRFLKTEKVTHIQVLYVQERETLAKEPKLARLLLELNLTPV